MSEFQLDQLIRLFLDDAELKGRTMQAQAEASEIIFVLPENDSKALQDILLGKFDQVLYKKQQDREGNWFHRQDGYSIQILQPEQKLQVFAKETDREHTEIDIFSTFNVAAEELDFKVLVVKELGALEAPGGNEATAAEATEEEAKKTTLENEIASLAKKIAGLPTVEKSGSIQNFYLDLEIRFEGNPNKDEILERIERTLLEQLLPDIYSPIDTEDAIEDRTLQDKMGILERLPFEELEEAITPANYQKAIDSTQRRRSLAILTITIVLCVEIGELEGQELPSGKIQVILGFCHCIYEQMRVASAPIGADDLIPILVRVVSFAKPKHLISDLRYIQRFHYHGHMKGQMAYSFTNILAVASFVEDVKIDETNGESIYNLVSRSSTNLKSSPRPQAHEPVPESPSALMRPLTEFNAMATTVFNKVTFVPRAITSAVADTFRSRSKSSTLEDHQQLGSASPAALPLPSDGEWCERTRQVHPATGELIPSDEVINSFRRKVVRLGSYDEMVVKDIPVMFADYKRLLMTYHFEPRPQAPPK